MTGQKRPRRAVGQVIEIDLGGGRKAFGRVLEEPLFAFYDRQVATPDTPTLDEITASPVAFKLWVMRYAISKGRWKVIGTLPLEPAMQVKPEFFKQDIATGKLTIHDDSAPPHYERPATLAECEGLECAAVWDPEHVEDRLRDHFAGLPNAWVESLRIRPLSAFDQAAR